jgi:26S proteasome regulatory subunit N5
MIRFHQHSNAYLDICRCYLNIYETKRQAANKAATVSSSSSTSGTGSTTPVLLSGQEEYMGDLERCVLFLVLSPFDQAQSDLLQRILSQTDKAVLEHNRLRLARELLKVLSNQELINLPKFKQVFYGNLQQHPVFSTSASGGVGDVGKQRFQDLEDRIVENNIRVVARHYTRIRTKRLSEILYLQNDRTELFVSKMVNNKTIQAKIDRLEGTIRFLQAKSNNEILNSWSQDTMKLLTLVERSVHLVNTEMVSQEAQQAIKDKQQQEQQLKQQQQSQQQSQQDPMQVVN